MVHQGKEASFKKALLDYRISEYLLNTSAPSVLFLNAAKVATDWSSYEKRCLSLIGGEISGILTSGKKVSLDSYSGSCFCRTCSCGPT